MISTFISFEDFRKQTKTEQNINNSLIVPQNQSQQIQQNISPRINTYSKELQDEFEYSKKQNGLIEKFADKIKSALKLKNSSRMIQQEIDSKQKSESEIKQDLKKYRRSQESVAQSSADIVSSVGAMSGFFITKQFAEKTVARFISVNNNKTKIIESLRGHADNLPKFVKKLANVGVNIVEKLNRRSFAVIGSTVAAMGIGMILKSAVLNINDIGSKKYKIENKKSLSKEELKAKKKEMKKKKRSIERRNVLTGLINGLSVPVISILGPVGAVPYLLINSLSKYFIGSYEDKNQKNFKNFIDYQKAAPVTQIASTAIIGACAIKKGQYNKVFEKNFDNALEKIKKAKLEKSFSGKSYYEQMEDILFRDGEISKIMLDRNLSTSEKIRRLSDENIFAVKFKQINHSSDELAQALKSDCPPTRTIQEAQKIISNTYGEKYHLTKLAGVGTVAESYIATTNEGKEVCIKIIKEGITKEKIAADRDKFIEIVKKLNKSSEEKEFFIKNIENIAEGVIQEVDLTNEMNAAKELAKITTKAKLVKPVEVKNNVYVMEKATGITLSDLLEYESNSYILKEHTLEELEKLGDPEKIKTYKRCMELKELGAGDLTEAQTKKMLENYQDILIEQFNKIDSKGKIIHADIHPGNIFIDIDSLKKGNKKCFTLIDTGNTIQLSPQMALRSLNLTRYCNNGDFDNIARFALEGAKLPEGMTAEQACEKLSQELKKYFFDDKTYLGQVTNDNILSICEQINQKLGIISSDVQGNLRKAKTSAEQSLEGFMSAFDNAIMERLENMNGGRRIANALKSVMDIGKTLLRHGVKTKIQETTNLFKFPLSKISELKSSKLAPKKNSEEYLTYFIKQGKELNNNNSSKISLVSELMDDFA